MSFINDELLRRGVPALPEINTENFEETRLKLVDILSEHVYGYGPSKIGKVEGKLLRKREEVIGGIAINEDHEISIETPKGEYKLYAFVTRPMTDKPVPMFLYIGFPYASGGARRGENSPLNPVVPERVTVPYEEIVESGCAIAVVYNRDISADSSDFTDGLAGMFPRNDKGECSWGKLGIWAYGVSRALDYLLTLDYFDKDHICTCGHSRLGKTSLWCAAQDTRVTHVISNDSGCSGAAITRKKQGEKIADICGRIFPFWFCEKYKDYIGEEETAKMPFDQHFLLAAIAPRRLYIASASRDIWADPASEYLCACAASPVYEALGVTGFAGDDKYPDAGDEYHDGTIEYHNKPGTHSITRYDWHRYCEFIKKPRI